MEMGEATTDTWIIEKTIFLSTGLPPKNMSLDERGRLAVRNWSLCLLNDTLYHKGADGIWWCAVLQFEKKAILRETHCRIGGGHYAGEATTRKIWNSGLWWPMTMKDAVKYCWQCDLCHRTGQPTTVGHSSRLSTEQHIHRNHHASCYL